MDNNKAKLILSVYRSNGMDAQDPLFGEALQQAESDPSLRAWLAEQRAFDAQVSSALASISGPAAGRAMIETTLTTTPPRRRSWRWALALAACLTLFLGLRLGFNGRGGLELPENASLAELAVNLSDHHASIGLMSPDYAKLRAWISQQGGPVPGRLPPGLEKMAVLGCETWKTTRGKVSLVCFVGEDMSMVHLYVFDQVPAALGGTPLPELGEPRIERSGNWSLAVWRENDRAFVLGVPAKDGQPSKIEGYFRT